VSAALVVVLIWFLFLPAGTAGSTLLPVGHPAPAFTLPDSSGHATSLSQYRGHPLILNFWATFCEPCRTETPLLQRTVQTYQHQGFTILGIDQGEPNDAIRAFGTAYGLTYPLLADSQLQVNRQYGVTALPATYFIDATGVVRATSNGILTPSSLASGLHTIGIAPPDA